MSDIQEEQKRLYKRAEENDETTISIQDLFDERNKNNQRISELVLQREELENRINKAIDFIDSFEIYEPDSIDTSDYENLDILGVFRYIENILKGDNK